MIKLFIFDVGGVIRDSSELMAHAFRKGFESVGLKIPFSNQEMWKLRGIGKYNNSRTSASAILACMKNKTILGNIIKKENAEELLDSLVQKLSKQDHENIDKILPIYKKEFHEGSGELVKIIDGVPDALDKLAKKYKLAIFSNSSITTIKRDVGALLSRFSLVLSGEDVKNKKPSGEGIVLACEKLKIKPEDSAYIGDSDVDILAAKEAGCKSIVLLTGMRTKNHLENLNPDYIFNDMKEMAGEFC